MRVKTKDHKRACPIQSHTMKTTPLHPAHLSLGAQMIEFAGWDIPARYASAIQEHHAVRSHAGMFDVSHMGRLSLLGPDAQALADSIVTADVAAIPPGHAKYCMACNEAGGILDDLIVYRLPDRRIFIVCNASNREVILDAIRCKAPAFPNATLLDHTEETAMIAVQGPGAVSIVQSLLPFNPDSSPLFSITVDADSDAMIARTGYTGEDGVELIVNADAAIPTWDRLAAAGVVPCGLVARDSLRMEAALRLYGNDMNTSINPFEAGLGRFVDLDSGPFTGKDSLLQVKARGPERRLAGFVMNARGIPRHGQTILHEGRAVGEVTSGGRAPSLNLDIGIGLLPTALARKDTKIDIDIRGRHVPATITPMPFYRRPRP